MMKSIINLFKISLRLLFVLCLMAAAEIAPKNQVPSCEQTIIYSINKLIEGGKEVDANIVIIVNPSLKTINMLAKVGETTAKFNVLIESKSCDLDLDQKKGMAIYQTYIKGNMNSSGAVKVKIEKDKIAISYIDSKQSILRKFIADKYEIVKE